MTSNIPPIHIDIINESTVCTDAEVSAMVRALQIQVSQHFCPVWGADAYLTFIPRGHQPYPQHWWIAVLNNSDMAGALGYHDVTSIGHPLGKVFAGTDKQYGYSVSVTLSHELLEILIDPYINLTAQMPDGNFYAYEVCDAIEADELGYLINGILVSDFVYPAWFEGALPGARIDQMQHLHSGCPTLGAGGYISYYDPNTGQWHQYTARTDPNTQYRARAPVGSRRERRTIPIHQRIISTIKPRP